MSAFSRGFAQRLSYLRAPPSMAASRCFTYSNSSGLSNTNIIFRMKSTVTKPSIRSPTKVPNTVKKSRTPPQPIQYQTYADILAKKDTPTLLYRAPSHTLFLAASYAGATFCTLYAVFNYNANVLHPPEGLPTFVPYAFGGVCFLMAVLGGYILLSPTRIIRSISAVSNKTLPGGLEMQVELRKMLPIPEWVFPRRILSAIPAEVSLAHKLYTAPQDLDGGLSPFEKLRLRKQREAEIEKQNEIERTKILSAPFRHASVAFQKLFTDVGRTFSRQGFLKLDVKGQSYKLDITGGWALDQGRAIDRLVQVKKKL